MRKNYVQRVMIHLPEDMDVHRLAGKVNRFHVEVIERRLNQADLPVEKKLEAVSRIQENLKRREVDGWIE